MIIGSLDYFMNEDEKNNKKTKIKRLQLNSTHSLMRKDLTGHIGPNGHLPVHMPIIKLEKKINKTNMQNSW